MSSRDDRLPLKEWVLGVQEGKVFKAYPFSTLAQRVNARGELRATVQGQNLRIRYDAQHSTAQAVDTQGQPWPSTTAFWFAWFAFHSDTEVLSPR